MHQHPTTAWAGGEYLGEYLAALRYALRYGLNALANLANVGYVEHAPAPEQEDKGTKPFGGSFQAREARPEAAWGSP